MSLWMQPITLQLLKDRNQNTLADFLDIEFTEIGEDYLKARMLITPKHLQPAGIMNGGASCILAETIGSNAANYAVDLKQFYCVGLDINTNHVRSISEGVVIATTHAFHIGKKTHVWGIEIHNENEQLISISRLTMAVLERV